VRGHLAAQPVVGVVVLGRLAPAVVGVVGAAVGQDGLVRYAGRTGRLSVDRCLLGGLLGGLVGCLLAHEAQASQPTSVTAVALASIQRTRTLECAVGTAAGTTPRWRAAAARWAAAAARRAGLEPAARRRDAERKLAKARTDRDTARDRLARATAARDDLARRAENLAAQLEAARASADVAAGRDRTDLDYVFVVTYGRSGSTLLAGILSSSPGVMIRGENGGVLQDLFRYHQTMTHHRDRLARADPLPAHHPWWGIDEYRDESAYRDFRALLLDTVLHPAPDTRLVGFKEITWLPEQLPELLEFTAHVFPGARFILNTRNLADVAQSKWWARNPDAMAELTAMEQRYVDALDGLGDAGYRVHYDDYVADPTVLRGLFTWLGLEFDETRVREVMAVPHSY
jgi:hypothetical protein